MWGRHRQRIRQEDAVKHLWHCRQDGQLATVDSLAGAVGLSRRRAFRLAAQMQDAGLLAPHGPALELTADGQRLALRIVRAHRLWETYLAREAGMPLVRLHQAADRAEHDLAAQDLEALADHLGHPGTDPHGDPIPSPEGTIAPPVATPLCDWPPGQPGRVVHIEDEPAAAYSQIVAVGLRPGSIVRVLERTPVRLRVSDGEDDFALAPIVAACIQVAPLPRDAAPGEGHVTLDRWPDGRDAQIARLDPLLQGIGRRRLLDLGVTPGTRIQPTLRGMFGDTRAYRVRGATIALRREQARHVWVRPAPGSPVPG